MNIESSPLQGKEALAKFLKVSNNFDSKLWIKASWDLPLRLKPQWWRTRTDESGEVVAINYVFQLKGDFLTQFRWGGKDKEGVTTWKPDTTRGGGFDYLHNLSDLGATIYFYPNKPSEGISNRHVEQTNLAFYEIDHLSLDEQWHSVERLARSGLEPTAVIYTGGKSLHVYYRLSRAIKVEDWLRLNRKLAIIQGGDPAICNAARAMRLPGMVRRKSIDESLTEPTEVSLEQWSETNYSPEEFEQVLDSFGLFPHGLSDERWRQWRNAALKARKGENTNPTGVLLKPEANLNPKPLYSTSTSTTPADPNVEFPLEICLTRSDRELLTSGVPSGSRDNSGYKLAVNLVATARRLIEVGYRFSGSPEQLFDDYCSRCNPPLSSRDRNRIWKQAERSTSKPSLDDTCLTNCIKAWQAEVELPQHQPHERRATTKSLQGNPKRASNTKKYIRPISELPEVGFHVIRRNTDELPFDALSTKRGKEWLQLRKFTPDVTINSRYVNYEFKEGENLAINSGLGTGKSYFTNADWLNNPEEGAVSGGYRNCLNEQFCANGEKLNGRPWYQIQQDLKGAKDLALIADPSSRIAGAVDSWIYFAPHHFDEKKVIFDEVESVAKHLNQSSTAVSFYRDTIKSRVSDALQNSKAYMLADGNLRDFTVEYFEKLSGKKTTKILNKYTGNRGKIYLYNGSSRKRKATESDVEHGLASRLGEWISFDHKRDDYSKLHRIMMDLPTDIPILILCDSQKKCEAWDKQLSALGRKVFRLDSTTSGTDLGRQFLRNPRKFILLHKIDVVILSPSAESGVSIELPDELHREVPGYFKYEFAFFFGTSTTDGQLQFVGRNRDPYVTKFVYVQSHSLPNARQVTDEETSNDIFSVWIETVKDCASLSLEGIEEGEILKLALEKIQAQLLDPHIQYEAKLMLKESFEREYPRLCFEHAAREAGSEVITVESREDDLSDLRAIQQEVGKEKAKAVFGSETVSTTEADKLAKKLNKTPEERNQITKSRLLTKLPGIEQKTITEQKKVTTPEQIQKLEESHLEKIVSVAQTPYEDWKAAPQPIPEKGISVVIEKPAFSPDFIDKVTNQDRAFVSRLEMQFLLRNPDICKLIQQNKWHKQLDLLTDPDRVALGGLPIARYRSKLLEVCTLIEMGIGFFLNPENSWHKESPEALAFWEKGKISRNARNTGIGSDDDPCAYIGKVLKRFGLKAQNKKKSNPDGTRYRGYSIAPMDSLSQAVYDCVAQRIQTQVSAFNFDWKKILKNSRFETPATLTEQELQAVHYRPDNYIKTRGLVDSASAAGTPAKELATSGLSTAAQLCESFEYCETPQDLALVLEGFQATPEQIQDAIALQGTQPRRRQLSEWYQQLSQKSVGSGEELARDGEMPGEVLADCEMLRSVVSWRDVTLSQERLDAAWSYLSEAEQHRLLSLYAEREQQPEERAWGITRQQAEQWGARFEWIRGGVVRIMYAAFDYVKLSGGEYVNYSELRLVT